MTNSNQSFLFILGSRRSGTTLIQRVLNTNADIFLWGEFNDALTVLGHLHNGVNGDVFKNGKNIASWQEKNEFQYGENIYPETNFDWDHEIREHLNTIFAKDQLTSYKYIGMKTIATPLSLHQMLQRLKMNAKYISVIRDPVKTLLGLTNTFEVDKPFDELLDINISYYSFVYNHILTASKENPENHLVVKYDDYIKNFDQSMEQIYTFLGNGVSFSGKEHDCLASKEGRFATPKKDPFKPEVVDRIWKETQPILAEYKERFGIDISRKD